MPYKLLPHTADLAVEARATSREELVQEVLRGMFEAAEPEFKKGGKKVRRAFEVDAEDLPSLLVEILSEAISLSDTHYEAYDSIEFDSLDETKAKGTFIGRPVTRFETQLKAATHHELEVKESKRGLKATVIFDV